MATARQDHTATLLTDGKVMVVGGYNSTTGTLASAELYDPTTGVWNASGSLSSARRYHTATVLPNGKLLVAGGYTGAAGALASVEIYNPAAGTWTITGTLKSTRQNHTATLLPNGKILVAGGSNGSAALSSAELYDPNSGTWVLTGSMSGARMLHSATLLSNGKVLVAGGTSTNNISSAELYDPVTGTWEGTGSMITGRYSFAATLLPNGKVLVAGGSNGRATLSNAELYNPITGTWTAAASMSAGRYVYTATLLASGLVLVAGGNGGGDSAELYDLDTGTWKPTPKMSTPRSAHTATLLTNGKVLVAGGLNIIARNSAEVYNPDEGVWKPAAPCITSRNVPNYAATMLANGKALVVGGQDFAINLSSAELYDPSTGSWTLTGSMSTGRRDSTATLLSNGKVLVAGGYYYNFANGYSLSSAEVYDPITGTWTATGSMSAGRSRHTATLLPDGKVLVAGGGAEIYDPATGQWTVTGPLNHNRSDHTATLLLKGKVLVAGGVGGGGSAELYDPATGKWTLTSSMAISRDEHTATLLPNGKVLVAGGEISGGYTSTAELYDPDLGQWTTTGSMAVGRGLHTATLLPNGKVLVACSGVTADLYDPSTGKWTATGAMITSHDACCSAPKAVLLPNGKVLVPGVGALSELYETISTAPGSRIISLSGNLAYGTVAVGTTSQRLLTISNSGNSALQVSSISYPTGFTGVWSGSIATGSSVNVTVTFAPTAATSYGGTVTVNSDKTSGTNTVTVSGTGTTAPTRIIGLGGNLGFGDIPIGTTATRTLTISNNGNTALTVTSIIYPAGFSGAWNGSIPTGGLKNVTVSFNPTAAVSYGGQLTVNSDANSGGNTLAISGTGAGTTDCTYSFATMYPNVQPASASTGFVDVLAPDACIWTANSSVDWLTITAGSGSGNGRITYTVDANSGMGRTGSIIVQGKIFNIQQAPHTLTIVDGIPVVAPGYPVQFAATDFDPSGNWQNYLWNFGDWNTNHYNTSTETNPSHTYGYYGPASCGQRVVTLTMSDGNGASVSTSTVVDVACPFEMGGLTMKVNFAPGKLETASLKAIARDLLPPEFAVAGLPVTVYIGSVSNVFILNEKGQGISGLSRAKLTNKNGVMTLTVKLKGDWDSDWQADGLTDETVVNKDVLIRMLLLLGNDETGSLYLEMPVYYNATKGKSGSVKWRH